ncbi:LysR family transcriptional regulator [Caulobacter mirabilis]|uniref:LuxR family transcriptional regulator n=1 Tax=Caulobacter mirabilis TaxID=69666 RepID=A0A2D2B0D3_9CAUL|nr:LysR family transcriptional regulator [Caulobacter mirabilis]ATQ43647.1 LuxR family transcriptional regulator [Caulobacter mirabilis]
MLDPRLLRAFVAISETGSFTQAAERLHMTQSTISQQLGRLEQAVGRALIDRTDRPVRVTASGERLLGYARRILALQSEAETQLADTVGASAIRIGVPEDIVSGAMADAFAAFIVSHRQARIDVTTGLSRDLTRRYRAGEFDIVVVKEPVASADCLANFPEPIGWFEPIGGAAESMGWPDPIPLVAFPPGGLYRDAMFERIERERRNWYVAFSSGSLHSILVAVEAGLGLSLLPVSTTVGRAVRLHPTLGLEAPMVVSVYAWERSGLVGELAETMTAVLAGR